MKVKFTNTAFKLLFDKILDRCEKENHSFDRHMGKGARLFGFGRFSNNEYATIKSIMCKNKHINNYLNTYALSNSIKFEPEDIHSLFNGKYLYNIHRELSNESISVSINTFYTEIYLKFIGYKTTTEFFEKNLDEDGKRIQNALLSTEDGKPSKLAKRYIGYYYSFISNSIKTFDLEIDFIHNLTVKEEGLHDSIKGATDKKDFYGTGIVKGNNLYISLESNDGIELKFIFYRGNEELQNLNIIRGIYSTVSSNGYPISGETVLLKESYISPEAIIAMEQYLFLQRKILRVAPEITYDYQYLKAKKYPLSEIQHMIGYYRIWSEVPHIGKESKNLYYQSRFTINQDYSAHLETVFKEPEDKIQPCWLWITDGIDGKNLCATSYQNRGIKIRNYTIIKIPPSPNFEATMGVFCGIGVREKGLLASRIFLKKISKEEADNIKIKSISKQEVENDKTLGRLDKLFRRYFKIKPEN